MREIKFRAWDKKEGKLIWGCSNLMLDMGGTFFWQFGFDSPMPIPKEEAEKYTLMQYTGLKDKNGVEIYEGDIVFSKDAYQPNFIIEWGISGFVMFDGENGILHDEYDEFIEDCEVIGNIYQNPELLEQE